MNIHPTAFVEEGAILGKNTTIGAFTLVRSNVRLGANSVIESFCDIGYPAQNAVSDKLIIGDGARIRSHNVIYSGSVFGPQLETGHHVTIRERTKAGVGLRIGTFGDIQGHCEIGDYLRAHSNVHISHGAKIGNFVWLYPGTLFTNDPNPPSNQLLGATLGDFVVVAVKATLLPGVSIGSGSFVTAHTLVRSSFEPNSIIDGNPGRRVGDVSLVRLRTDPKVRAYPWTTHFTRGYPDGALERFLEAEKSDSISC